MLARRIIAVSPDPQLGRQLAAGMATLGEVELATSLDVLHAADPASTLCVVHLAAEPVADVRMILASWTGVVIAVVPRGDLAAAVELMRYADCVVGVLLAAELEPHDLSTLARRAVHEDPFGLQKVVAAGTRVHTELISEHDEVARCLAAVGDLAERSGARPHTRVTLEQCIDELVTNALYAAPVDEQGAHVFADVPPKARFAMRTEQSVTVEYAYDGERFAVAVRDAFGSLGRATVLDYLDKCLTSSEPVDRKAGGAGVGLYLMAMEATAVTFTVAPGIATEVVCTFDLDAARGQLSEFGFCVRADVRGHAAPPAHRLPSRRARTHRLVNRAIAATAAALVVTLGVLGWRLLTAPKHARLIFTTTEGATIEVEGRTVGTASHGALEVGDLDIGRAYRISARRDGYEPRRAIVHPDGGDNPVAFELQAVATVELASQPDDATVEIDGKRMGSTPLALTSLAPDIAASVVFRRPGFRDATARVHVPARGEHTRVVVTLVPDENFARVHFVSAPPGAQVLREGESPGADRTYTPADIVVPVGQIQHVTLAMPGHAPLVIPPFVADRGTTVLEKSGALIESVRR